MGHSHHLGNQSQVLEGPQIADLVFKGTVNLSRIAGQSSSQVTGLLTATLPSAKMPAHSLCNPFVGGGFPLAQIAQRQSGRKIQLLSKGKNLVSKDTAEVYLSPNNFPLQPSFLAHSHAHSGGLGGVVRAAWNNKTIIDL